MGGLFFLTCREGLNEAFLNRFTAINDPGTAASKNIFDPFCRNNSVMFTTPNVSRFSVPSVWRLDIHSVSEISVSKT